MMNFREFKESVYTSLRGYLTPRYGEVDIREQQVYKNNCTLTGLTIEMKEVPDNISPTFYVEPLYDQYQSGYEFDEVMEQLEIQLKKSMEEREIVREQVDMLREAKEKICFDLIHTEQNQEMLKGVPHREFMNLSIVYRAILVAGENGMATALITNQMAKYYELDEQELYDLAYENTKNILQPEVKRLGEMITELLGEDVAGEQYDTTDESKIPFYVVTNCFRERGAINVIYPEVMQAIAENVGSDLYLLPSSTHEMLVAPTERMTHEELAEMLHEVNPTLDVMDRLSNDIYKYDRSSQSFEQVTDYSDISLADMTESEGLEMCM